MNIDKVLKYVRLAGLILYPLLAFLTNIFWGEFKELKQDVKNIPSVIREEIDRAPGKATEKRLTAIQDKMDRVHFGKKSGAN